MRIELILIALLSISVLLGCSKNGGSVGSFAGQTQQTDLPSTTPDSTGRAAAPSSVVGQARNGSVSLTWIAPPMAVSSYTVKYGTSSGNCNLVAADGVTSWPLTINGLQNGTNYYFVVLANSIEGTSQPSTEVTITPLAPLIVVYSLPKVQSVQVYWNPSGNANHYTLRYGTLSQQYTHSIDAGSSTSVEVTGLNPTLTYYFNVEASNGSVTWSSGSEISATQLDVPQFNLNISSSNSIATISWLPSADANSYTLQYGTSSGNYTQTVSTNAQSPVEVSGLTIGQTYYFSVTASNGVSTWSSSEASIVPIGSTFQIASTVPGASKVILTWSNASGSSAYKVMYGTSSANVDSVASTHATSPFEVTGLTNGVTYYFSVIALNGSAQWAANNVTSATPNLPIVTISGTAGNYSAQLSWTTVANATFLIKYGTVSGNYPFTASSCSQSPCTVSNLDSGTNYYFRVVTTLNGTSWDSNNELQITALQPIFSFTTTTENMAAQLNWVESSPATSYTVRMGTSSGSYTTTVSDQAHSPFTISGLSNETTYYIMVSGTDGTHTWNATAEQSVTPIVRGIIAAQLGLLINDDDPDSVEIGNYYKQRRNIPDANVLHLHVPITNSLSRTQFASIKLQIDSGLPAAVQGIAIAWIKPYRVECNSITSAITLGFMSVPCDATGTYPTCNLATANVYYGSDSRRPYTQLNVRPSMLVASWTVADTKNLIDRGVASDNTQPTGQVAHIMKTTDSTRSLRANIFPSANLGTALSSNVTAQIDIANTISNYTNAMFYFQGLATVTGLPVLPTDAANTFPPGAIADHLTSCGGFTDPIYGGCGQMSALAFITAGATGSFGTVTEPCAHSSKFPDPSIVISNYTKGDTLIEAYWKSVQQPFQGLFVGEPLANPWKN